MRKRRRTLQENEEKRNYKIKPKKKKRKKDEDYKQKKNEIKQKQLKAKKNDKNVKKNSSKTKQNNRYIIEMEISREINVYNKYLVMYLPLRTLLHTICPAFIYAVVSKWSLSVRDDQIR